MNKLKKIFSNPILCIILGSIAILASIIFAPVWDFWEKCPWRTWGNAILDILIALIIVAYLAFYVVKKIKTSTRQVIRVLTIIEFVLLALVAIGCIFTQAKLIKVSGACQIFGLALWIRGTIELFRAYYHQADSKEKYPVWLLALSIFMVTFGTFAFAKPFISNLVILWVFVIALFLFGALLLVVGITTKKVRKK